MITRSAAIAIAVGCALVLGGCVSAGSYPSGPDDAQIEAERMRILDLTWQNLGLTGERPTPAVTPIAPGEFWNIQLYECAQDRGIALAGYGYSSDTGYDFASDRDIEQSALRDLYACVAAQPLDPFFIGEFYSEQQVDYLYDYYSDWLVPCLELHGLAIDQAPTKSEFVAGLASWSPYDSLTPETLVASDNALRNCGPDPAHERLNGSLVLVQQTADELEGDR